MFDNKLEILYNYIEQLFNEYLFKKWSDKMTTRDEQREKRRQEILLCSLDIFIKRGFAATKIRDIAKELGISTGLLFHYFESKEKLYEELIHIAVEGAKEIMQIEYESGISFFESIAQMALDSFVKDPMSTKLFLLMNQATTSDAVSEEVKAAITKVNNIESSIPIIIKGQKEGGIKVGDPLALATVFWGSMQGIAEVMACMPNLPCPESSWIVDILRRKDS